MTESEDLTAELTTYMRDVSWEIYEMVKILRGLATSLSALNETMSSINISLGEIRKFLILGP